MNSDTGAELRRVRDNLRSDGAGYILFGVWGVLKILITVTMNKPFLEKIMEEMEFEADDDLERMVANIVMFIFFAIIALITLLVHLYIGLGAVRYSKGTKKKKGFLVAAVILIILTIHGITGYFDPGDYRDDDYDSLFASVLVDLTAIFLLVDMLYSVYRIKRMEKLSVGEGQVQA